MNLYLYETYSTFSTLFYIGWIVWAVLFVVLGLILKDSNHKHKGSMSYYFIIINVVLVVIGVLGTIFLPTTDVMKLILGLK